MATPLDVGRDVADTMAGVSKVLARATKESLTEAAKVAKDAINAKSPGPTGGDRRFSNMRRYNHGGRLGVKTRQRSGQLWVIPAGPWKLAETGAAPHPVNHPGTRQGTRAWTRGQVETFAKLERTVPDDIARDVEEAFNGR
jgi:hypothetical protein